MYCFRCILYLLLLLLFSAASAYSRSNSLVVGVSASADIDERQYAEETAQDESEDDSQQFVLTPLIRLTSLAVDNSFEALLKPSIKYDLLEYETDWDMDFYLSAEQSFSKKFKVSAYNSYLRSDYADQIDSDSSQTAATQSQNSNTTSLSGDVGRSQYSKNTFQTKAVYDFEKDTMVGAGFSYELLKNSDDSDAQGYENYDRYEVFLFNDYRFTQQWKGSLSGRAIRGVYYSPDGVDGVAGILPNDLMEYRLGVDLSFQYDQTDSYDLTYDYIGARYDEAGLGDNDIHQARVNWRKKFSRQVSTVIGVGPTYTQNEERDDAWSGNGIAQIHVSDRRWAYSLSVEKGYDVENFSGTSDKGTVDYWSSYLKASLQFTEAVSVKGKLTYKDEQKDRVVTADDTAAETELESYDQYRYGGEAAVEYRFSKEYSASLLYRFTRQESDLEEQSYDDHRLLLTVSWNSEILHW